MWKQNRPFPQLKVVVVVVGWVLRWNLGLRAIQKKFGKSSLAWLIDKDSPALTLQGLLIGGK